MVFFNSVSIFRTVVLTSLPTNSSIWASSHPQHKRCSFCSDTVESHSEAPPSTLILYKLTLQITALGLPCTLPGILFFWDNYLQQRFQNCVWEPLVNNFPVTVSDRVATPVFLKAQNIRFGNVYISLE